MPKPIDPQELRARTLPLMPLFLLAARKFDLDPLVLAAVCDRETLCGTSKDLRWLTGDFAPRPTGGRYELGPRYRAAKAKRFDRATQKWVECDGVLPKDGLGWGRGLMQIDYASFYDWLQTADWRDPPTNILKGAEVLRGKLDYCRGNEAAGVCGYNAGEGNARHILDRLSAMPGEVDQEQLIRDLDAITTGGDYVSDIFARRQILEAPTPGVT